MGWGPKAPEPDPAIGRAAESNSDIARRAQELAERQDARNAASEARMAPIFEQLMRQSIEQSEKDEQRSDAQWDSYTRDFAPLESRMAETAANFDTPERREEAAGQAVAGVRQQFERARERTSAALAASGAQPGSGAARAILDAGRIEEAKASAGAGTMARRNVEQQGIALVDNAARFGRNMPSTGLAVSQAAQQSGNNAVGLSSIQQQQQLAGYGAVNQGYGVAVGANGSAGDLYLGRYNGQLDTFKAKTGIIGDVLSAAGQAAAAYFASSSKRLKDEVGDVDTEEAAISVAATPKKAWRYKEGSVPGDDGRVRVGRYAEDAAAATGLGDGETLDLVSENGLNQAAIQFLLEREAQRDPKLQAKLNKAKASIGLSDTVEG